MRRVLALATIALTLAASAGCGGESRPSVTVAAASDVRPAFEALATAFEAACACDVEFVFGSSGNLATQIEEGLPADVFASADEEYVDRLAAAGIVVDGSRAVYAIGRIVLVTRHDSGIVMEGIESLLDERIRRVAIANPDHAPYGRIAKDALVNAGLWDAIEPKLVFGENAAQAIAFVETGDAQAGVVPLSLAIQKGEALAYEVVDAELYAPLVQAAVVAASSDDPALARRFIAFITGPEARPVMEKYGFVSGEEAQQ